MKRVGFPTPFASQSARAGDDFGTGALAMTDGSSIANVARPRLSERRRFQLLLAIIGCYFFIAFATPFLTDAAKILLLMPSEPWNQIDAYWLYGCVVLIAGWVALGPGRMAIRGVQGIIVAGWLLLAWMLGLTMSPNWQPGLGLTVLTCATVAVASLGILVLVRRCFGTLIARIDGACEMETRRFQYSLTTLLLVMLLICVTLAIFGWIDPRYRNYTQDPSVQSLWYPGWSRRELAERIGSATLGTILIAAACLPVFLSQRNRTVAWAVGVSAAAFTISLLMDASLNVSVYFPLFSKSSVPWYFQFQVTNLATIIVSLLTAAAAMRWLGYQLAAATPETRPSGAG